MFDAAAGFGGYKQSGYGRDGGKEGTWSQQKVRLIFIFYFSGMLEYVKPRWQVSDGLGKVKLLSDEELGNVGVAYNADRPAINGNGSDHGLEGVDRTYKLYYGGAQKRPDGNYSAIVRDAEGKAIAEVGQANRKDVRNAVEVSYFAHQLMPLGNSFSAGSRKGSTLLGETLLLQSRSNSFLRGGKSQSEEAGIR